MGPLARVSNRSKLWLISGWMSRSCKGCLIWVGSIRSGACLSNYNASMFLTLSKHA